MISYNFTENKLKFIPGEIITEDNLRYIKKNMEAGLPVQGPEDYDFKMLRVIKEHRAIK